MSPRDLFEDPLWKATDLGRPIPESLHAISVALPRWQDVVGYEEGRPEVIERLASGYPRFVIHPLVQTLAQRLGGGMPCLPFPSSRAAQMCGDFIRRSTGEGADFVTRHGVYGVRTSETGKPFFRTSCVAGSRRKYSWIVPLLASAGYSSVHVMPGR